MAHASTAGLSCYLPDILLVLVKLLKFYGEFLSIKDHEYFSDNKKNGPYL
jgi:hypothetical protein